MARTTAKTKAKTTQKATTVKKKTANTAKVAKKSTTTKKSATATKKATSTKAKSKSTATRATRKTRVIVRFDVGFNNQVFVRGSCPELSWEAGVPLENIAPDTWVWETKKTFNSGEFKVLINDLYFEGGENRIIAPGETVEYTPQFPPTW